MFATLPGRRPSIDLVLGREGADAEPHPGRAGQRLGIAAAVAGSSCASAKKAHYPGRRTAVSWRRMQGRCARGGVESPPTARPETGRSGVWRPDRAHTGSGCAVPPGPLSAGSHARSRAVSDGRCWRYRRHSDAKLDCDLAQFGESRPDSAGAFKTIAGPANLGQGKRGRHPSSIRPVRLAGADRAWAKWIERYAPRSAAARRTPQPEKHRKDTATCPPHTDEPDFDRRVVWPPRICAPRRRACGCGSIRLGPRRFAGRVFV